MKRAILCALAFHAAGALAQSPPAEPAAPQVVVAEKGAAAAPAAKTRPAKRDRAKLIPDEIFAAELKDLYDVSFSLGEYRGRVFVLNFWASWCGPCRAEIPELNRLREEYAPRGVEFVGLTVENPGAASEKVREFASKYEMTYRVGWADPDVAMALMTRNSIPQTIVVGADGRVVARLVGFSKEIPRLLRAGIEQALKPPPEEEDEPEEAEPEPAAPAPPPPAAPPAAPETSRRPRA
jgi:thiol-disulfide isomerase/thioredoxin